MNIGQWILLLLQGTLVGSGTILPGVSGGVLLVAFGIYRPLMALLSHPIKSFRVYWRLFVPFLIGWLLGFVALAEVLNLLLNASSAVAVSLFVGLIAGTLPALFREAGKEGRTNASWAGFAASLVLVYGLLSFLDAGSRLALTPNAGWFFFCGAVWGLSMVLPGLSSSSILLFMGLYEPMTAGIAALAPVTILPLIGGTVLTVGLLARSVNWLFEKHHAFVSHTILGIVLASTLLIVPKTFGGALEFALSFAVFAAGFAAALLLDRYGERVKKAASEEAAPKL